MSAAAAAHGHPAPADVAPLPEAVDAALAAIEGPVRREVHTIRDSLLSKTTRLAGCMRRIERGATDWPGWMLAEFWGWIAYLLIVQNCRPDTTVDVYANATGRFLGWCVAEGVDPRTLTHAQFDSWQKWLWFERGNSARHRGKQICGVRSYYAWRSSRLGGRDCLAGVRFPKVEQLMPRKYTPEQLRAMIEQVEHRKPWPLPVRDRALLLLLLATGARRFEVPQLNLDDLQLRSNTGTVAIRGKGQRERVISIEGPVVEALHAWLIERDRLEHDVHPTALFVGVSLRWPGRRLSTKAVEDVVGFAARRAGLKEWGVHRFRITFATWLYDQGVDIEEIRILMGHRSIETTRRYLSVSERARKTRLSSQRQHQVLGTRNAGRPRWMAAALGGSRDD